MKFFYVINFFIIFASCKAQQGLPINKDNNTLLWEVSGSGLQKPTYLFGTFHMMCKQDIAFSENFKKALALSNKIYFELDLDDPKSTLGAMFFMNMKNKSLKELYTETEYKKVALFFKDSVGTDLTYLQKWKPMMLEALLYPRLMSCKNASGVEMEILTLIASQKKEILGLETIEFQTSVFDSIPYQLQAKALIKTIDSSIAYKSYFNKMMQVYKNQQVDELLKIIEDTTFAEGLNNDVLLKNRNINWVKQLNKIMADTNVMVAVGAAHLYGKDGLIALLKNQGYTVSPIQNN